MRHLAAALMVLFTFACASSDAGKTKSVVPSEGDQRTLRAEELLRQGKVKFAKLKYKSALRVYQKGDDLKKIAETYLRLGQIGLIEADYKSSSRYLKSAKVIAENEGYGELAADIAISEASVMLAEGRPEDAATVLEGLSPKFPQREMKIENMIGMAEMAQSDFESAENRFEKVLKKAKSGGDVRALSAAYANLGALNIKKGNPQKAVEYLERALAIEKEIGFTLSIGETLHLTGKAYETAGDYTKALYYYNRALHVNIHVDIPKRADADREAVARMEEKIESKAGN